MKVHIGKYVIHITDDGEEGTYSFETEYDGHVLFGDAMRTWQQIEVEVARVLYKAWNERHENHQ